MRNSRGQILLPGLVIFWALTMMLLALIFYGRHVLMQMRANTAAEATALSVARAQAEMMNKFASYNLEINPLLFPAYHGFAAPQKIVRPILEIWAAAEFSSGLPYFLYFPRNVGRRVAQANGCDPNPKYIPTPPHLVMQDIRAWLMVGYEPTFPPEIVYFEHVNYARTWKPGQRKAQPPHQTHWLVKKDGRHATASARLYLDVQPNEPFQNGGFPSVDAANWWDDAQVQSFYPQFSARLLDHTPLGFKTILEHLP